MSLQDHASADLAPTEPTVERLGVEDLPARPRPRDRRPSNLRLFEREQPPETVHVVDATPAPVPVAVRSAQDDMFIGVLRGVAMALSARALILVAIVGGFVLGLIAVLHESRPDLYVMIAWFSLTVLPLVGVEIFARRD